MADIIHNLDDSVSEYINFTLLKHSYRFKHLNTEELEELESMKEEKDLRNFLFSRIEAISPDAPVGEDLQKKLLMPHWRNLLRMLKVEMAPDANS